MDKICPPHKLCGFRECSKKAIFGEKGKVAKFCRNHKGAGMVLIGRRTCAGEGCEKLPSFGVEGSRTAVCCSSHKQNGMVDIHHKRCASPGCSKHSFFGNEATGKRSFCRDHQQPGMVDDRGNRCAAEGCAKNPSFGKKGTTTVEFCSRHKKRGMMYIYLKQCSARGCPSGASFAMAGRKEELCGQHKRHGMINVRKKTCASEGCPKAPSFATEGEKTAIYCNDHKTMGMVNVWYKAYISDNRKKAPSFGKEGTQTTDVRNMKAANDGSTKRPSVSNEDVKKTKSSSEREEDGTAYMRSKRHLTENHQAPATRPAVTAAEKIEEGKEEADEDAGGHVVLSRTTKRAASIEQPAPHVQKGSGSSDGGPSKVKRTRASGKETRSPSPEKLQNMDMGNAIALEGEFSVTSSGEMMNMPAPMASPPALGTTAAAGTGPIPGTVDPQLVKKEFDDIMGLQDLEIGGPGEGDVAPVADLPLSTVTMKPEFF